MFEQVTLGEIESRTDQEDTSEQDSPDDKSDETVRLFGITADPFVNESIADLAYELRNVPKLPVSVSPTAVTLQSTQAVESALDIIESLVKSRIERTHVRTDPARQINQYLSEQGLTQSDERWVPPADEPFPSRDGEVTIYEDDRVDGDRLEAVGVEPEEILQTPSGSRTLYALNPEFIGNSSSKHFPDSQVPRFRRYFESFAATLRGEYAADEAVCMNCGREDMPAYKGMDDEKLEYNQTFTPLAAASGRATALGYSGRDSAHDGRCAACLVAGFYCAVMEKIVRPTAESGNSSRVFTPVGNLFELTTIRGDFDSLPATHDIDPPTASEYYGRQTLGQLRTRARGMQVVEFYEQVLRHLNTLVEGEAMFEREITYRPTALISYISEVGQTRDIRNIERVDPESWAYDACRPRTVGSQDDPEGYWPVGDVLAWFAGLRTNDENLHITIQNDLAFGVLEQSLKRIERAIFETTKLLDRGDQVAPYRPHPQYRHHYFQFIMSQARSTPDSIDDEAIESIRRVGSALGRVFHGQDDIGVLIKLQNATTPSTFLQAFEKAAMQAQKRSHEQSPTRFETSRDDDVKQVLELIGDSETFEPAKRMFVIHASLAAQYENIADSDSGTESDTQMDSANS